MKILFVTPGAQFSIADVGRGYRGALVRMGHEVIDYNMVGHIRYHQRAMPPEVVGDFALVSKFASENITLEALYNDVDLVIIVSGLNVHPIALWSLSHKRINIPTAIVFTESPYDDGPQKIWMNTSGVGVTCNAVAFTNDLTSHEREGWHYLPPAFDPNYHHPVEAEKEYEADVVLVGTGWRDRQNFLEAANWDGINLVLWGVWPDMSSDSPLHKFVRPMVIDNANIAKAYASSKVCLNFHRRSPEAYTPNPRTYEIAACGAFQISDPRPGLVDMFGNSIPVFSTPEGMTELIRYYLAHEDERKDKASRARRLCASETFDHRAKVLIDVMSRHIAETTTVGVFKMPTIGFADISTEEVPTQ